jgi:hypothetical protein
MSTANFPAQAAQVWQNISAARVQERPKLFWMWCHEVTEAQKSGSIDIKNAAGLLMWPETLDGLEGLSDNADILMVLDTADAIVEEDAFLGVPGGEEDAWSELAERTKRQSAAQTQDK